MKKYLTIFLLITGVTVCNGQSVSEADSLQIMGALGKVFKSFEKPDFSEFKQISTEQIKCFVCEGARNSKLGSYAIKRKRFFDNNLKSIKESDSWKRASKSNEIKLHKQKAEGVDIVVFLTIWGNDEYAPGHEGAQLGIHFLKVNGEYKFAGIETVP